SAARGAGRGERPSSPTRRSSELIQDKREGGVGEVHAEIVRAGRDTLRPGAALADLGVGRIPGFGEVEGERLLDRPQRRARGVERDRKSTRLNSSHVKISYAVFCL